MTKSWLGILFDLILVGMLVVCALSIIQSLAHAQVRREHETERTRMKGRRSQAS